MGGVLPALQAGFFQQEIAEASYRQQLAMDSGERVVVGVNRYTTAEKPAIPILQMDPEGYRRQVARLERLRLERDSAAVGAALERVRTACTGDENVMPALIAAAKADATLGEMTDVMRAVFGIYHEPAFV